MMVYVMKVVCVDCQKCGSLNQLSGSDLELVDLPGVTPRECYRCGDLLNFSKARIEDYQSAKTA